MSKLIQMNMSVSPEFVDEVGTLAERYGWSKRKTVETAIHALAQVTDEVDVLANRYGWSESKTIETAIRALAQVMDAHERFAAQYDDIGEIYMQLAAEMPAGFVEVPKDGVRIARAEGVPVVIIDNTWLIWSDPASGNVFAEEQGGQGRVAVVKDGEIKPLKVPTLDEVALN